MNVALILAGGIGARMHNDTPKQFLCVDDKPIIVYTLEAFQRHPEIDAIEVVALRDYIDYVWQLATQFRITKLRWVTENGENAQGSARNGVFNLRAIIEPNDILIIHDAIRPIVPQSIISDLLAVCREHGNAVSSLPMFETLVITHDQIAGDQAIDRKYVRRVQTPQAYRYSLILNAYETAIERGITDSIYANTLLIELGHKIYFSRGFVSNIKITTNDDLVLFRLLKTVNDEELV